jgi:Kdo2-lipid IVA lauroyltransferase/acyltransferase
MSDNPRPSLLNIRHWPSLIGVAFGWTIAQWPSWLQRSAATPLAALMWATMWERKRIASRNLQLCFPELSSDQREKLLRANFASQALSVFEFLRAWWGRVGRDSPRSTLSGIEHIQAAQKQGRGIILVAAHFHTLEIAVRLLSQHVRVTGIYRGHDTPWLEWAVRAGRARYTDAMIEREQMRPVLKHLKQGGVLWIAPDQESRRGESVFVSYFGQNAAALISTHQLARASSAAVIPFFHQRNADGSYSLELLPALDNFPGSDVQADTQAVMSAIEAMIRRVPDQYLWVHARFKRQPDQSNLYG